VKCSPEVEAYLSRARDSLRVAEKLLSEEEFPDAAGKAYYAMFYAAQALLKAHGIEVVKHSAVASMLGRHFAKTGRLAPRFHRAFIEARRIRETADYDLWVQVGEDTAKAVFEDARVFLMEIRHLLGQQSP
jgi:uncharacterized protein (UPF0332 family)